MNEWLTDLLQTILKPLLSQRTVSYLNPNPSFSQFQQSRSFIDGLTQASVAWKERFVTTARGLHRANWLPGPVNLDNVRRLIIMKGRTSLEQ